MSKLAFDTFQRANENPLSNGGNWSTTNSESANQIVSDVCEGSTTPARCGSFYSGVVWPNDQFSEVTLAGTPGSSAAVGAIVRCAAAAETYFHAQMANNGAGNFSLTLNHMLAGSSHQIGSSVTGITPVTGDVLRIQAIGTTISAWYNGNQVISVTDANIVSGSAGFYTQPSGAVSSAQISLWDAGNFTSNPAPQVTTLSSTLETIIIDSAPGMNNTLTGLVISTTGTTAGTLTIRDSISGTIRTVIDFPNSAAAPGAPFTLPKEFPGIFQSAPSKDWTVQASTAANTYHITAFYRAQ